LDRLNAQAWTDPLTGAANRRTLSERLDGYLAQAGRSGVPLSIVMLDLDHFKAFNDRRGHQAGDRLLREVTAAWQAELRPSDLLARYGGEEFVAVLPTADETTAVRVADRLRAAMPSTETVSAGAACWTEGESVEQLVAAADRALYAAKAGGRDRTVAASECRSSTSLPPVGIDSASATAAIWSHDRTS